MKLHRDKVLARLHMQLCSVYSSMGTHKEALLQGRLAITHSHNLITESSTLCRALVQCQRSDPKLGESQPLPAAFSYVTLNRLHSFNLSKELDLKEESVEANKAFYFEDNVRILDKLLLQYNGILKEFMKRITETERHLSREEDIVEFASSLSPKAASAVPQVKSIKHKKIKQRNGIGLKSASDFVFAVSVDDVLHLRPMRMQDLIPNLSDAASEVGRDSIYEKITLLAISYYIYGMQWKMLYEKTRLETSSSEFTYWNEAAGEICRVFLPRSSPVAEYVLGSTVATPRKSPSRKMLKENSNSARLRKAKKTPLTSPSKEEYRMKKLNVLGSRKRLFGQKVHNITQMKVLTKYLK
eukprot:TRINITY_DN1090_c0_g5_i1.p1 TRINITY_DN1090_c0_g5~~TRINITY_DN1090_c0_g5_i1.p1  ORF type:complete len:355 (-),score=80.18 TRINITY_DN1090_c0_g5_i1:306-1370(-)